MTRAVGEGEQRDAPGSVARSGRDGTAIKAWTPGEPPRFGRTETIIWRVIARLCPGGEPATPDDVVSELLLDFDFDLKPAAVRPAVTRAFRRFWQRGLIDIDASNVGWVRYELQRAIDLRTEDELVTSVLEGRRDGDSWGGSPRSRAEVEALIRSAYRKRQEALRTGNWQLAVEPHSRMVRVRLTDLGQALARQVAEGEP